MPTLAYILLFPLTDIEGKPTLKSLHHSIVIVSAAILVYSELFQANLIEAQLAPEGVEPAASISLSPTGETTPLEQLKQASALLPLGRQLASGLTLNGYLRNETAFRIVQPSAFSKIKNIFNLEPRYRIGRSVELASRIRSFYDAVYDLEDVDTISPRKGPITILSENLSKEQVQSLEPDNVRHVQVHKREIQLKELYLDIHRPSSDFRIGKQIVRWGVVEGSRVTDEINPLDLSEFILRDVEDRYIPLWMLKADFFLRDSTLEAIWIPDLKFHQPAARESEFEQFRFLPGLEKPGSPLDNPIKNIGNSEIAVRLSRLMGGWDLSASYFYTWDDFPASFRTIGIIAFAAIPQVDPITFQPRYTRLHIPGFTLSKALGKVVLNAEAAYVYGKVFGTRLGFFTGSNSEIIEGSLGETRADFLKYAVGLDTTLWRTDVSGQILQQYIPHHQPDIIQDQVDTILTFFLRRQFLDNLLTSQILTLFFVNDNELLVRPRFTYAIQDQTKLSFGADLMTGTIADMGPDGRLIPGQFHFVGFFKNNSRVYVEVQYSF